MSKMVELNCLDGTTIGAYVSRPAGEVRGLVIVIQEIFGITEFVRWVCDEQYAKNGYLAVAPAVFDRIEKNVELGYTPETRAQGIALVGKLGMDDPLRDIRATQRQFSEGLETGVVGYCWGGSVAFLAATRLGLPAVGYYGGRTASFVHEQMQAPALLHFGETDASIPMTAVATVRKFQPDAEVHTYPAGHGFNRFGTKDFHAESAALALTRSLEFFGKHL